MVVDWTHAPLQKGEMELKMYPRDGARSQGRKARWEDELKITLGPLWIRVAKERKQWKEMEEAFAVRHTELRDIL